MIDARHKQFVDLSWFLLEAKVCYYLFNNEDGVPDSLYDKGEKLYIDLCKDLYLPDTISTMVGIDQTRESVKSCISKVQSNKGIKIPDILL